MSATHDRGCTHPSADEANAAIRTFVRAHEGKPWTARDLAELHRLRAVWQRAVRGEVTTAA